VASLSQGRTAAAQCGLFTHKSVPVIFEPPCTLVTNYNHVSFSLAPYQCQNPESPPQNHWTDGLQHIQSSVTDGVQLTLLPPPLVAIALEK